MLPLNGERRKSGLQTKLFNLCFCFENTCFRPVGSSGQGFKHFPHSYFFTFSALLRQIIDQLLLQEGCLHVLHHLNLFEDIRLGELRNLGGVHLVPKYAVNQSQWSPSISASSDEGNAIKIPDVNSYCKSIWEGSGLLLGLNYQNRSLTNISKNPTLIKKYLHFGH